jgi:hypothetical protein
LLHLIPRLQNSENQLPEKVENHQLSLPPLSLFLHSTLSYSRNGHHIPLVGALHGDGVNSAYRAVSRKKYLIIDPECGEGFLSRDKSLSTSLKWQIESMVESPIQNHNKNQANELIRHSF